MNNIISKLRYFDRKFPRKELEEAIKSRNEITPKLLEALDEIIENPEIIIDNSDYMLHLYAMYLLAQFREKKAFPKIIDLVSLPPEAVEDFLGDMVTEGISSIMYSTYDGQLSLLQGVIENPLINFYVRGSALDLYGKLYLDGAFSKEGFVAYLRGLIDNVPYDLYTDLATYIQGVVMDYHIFEMVDDIHNLYDKGRIDDSMHGKYDSFIDWIYSYEYKNNVVKYIDDVIEEMQWWAGFEKPDGQKQNTKSSLKEMNKLLKKSTANTSKELIPTTPKVKKDKIGRNDPCPCGSGKKYKRCCIDKVIENAEEITIESDLDRERWLREYPKEESIRQEGRVYINDIYDEESIDIDKLVYLALHHRVIPIWRNKDTLEDYENKIAYLTEASDLFLTKCKKEGITSFEEYDVENKIHYCSEDWFKVFEGLLGENDQKHGRTLARIRETISAFS